MNQIFDVVGVANMMSCRDDCLSVEMVEFISRKMKIDVSSVLGKFNKITVGVDRKHLENAFARFAHIVMNQEISQGEIRRINSWDPSPAAVAINNGWHELSSSLTSEEARGVMDSLRHAFGNYADGGLHQLFTRQECEGWYPKVVLDEVLNPNDIDTLPDKIRLYRGTSINEFRTKGYRQSWSTCDKVAHDFAFTHYAIEPWFDKNERVVLKAVISKDHVYFSDQSHCEREVVVNVRKLCNVDAIPSNVMHQG